MPPLQLRVLLPILIAAFAAFISPAAQAHDPGLSSANLEITRAEIRLVLTFNQRDLAGVFGSSEPETKAVAARAIRLAIDGGAITPTAAGVAIDTNNNAEFRYTAPRPAGGTHFEFESLLLPQLPFGHRQAFAARDESGNEIARSLLSNHELVARFDLNPASDAAPAGSRFFEFLLLGIRHILTGYDHLLFLFGLLIVTRAPRGAVLLITCFTIAHSVTLALSTFGLVTLPSRFVEATIAASIVFVGLENLIRGGGLMRGRWLLTFAFGLIHGLGFAAVLHEMGIAKTGLSAVVPLVAFNSGVEIGQLMIAAIVLSALWRLRHFQWFARVGVPACSLVVAAAGTYWLLERTVLG